MTNHVLEIKTKYGVVGNPVEHSLSPKIHHAFAQEVGISLSYEKYCVSIEKGIFETFVQQFFEEGGDGLNITVPFKQRAFHCVNQVTERARLAGAVNTIIPLSSVALLGDNTDGVGLVRDLSETHAIPLQGKRIVILGSGGAAQGIFPALTAEAPREIVMVSRQRFPTYRDLDGVFDLVINATPLSLSNTLPPISATILGADSFCYDLAYNRHRETVFTQWAKKIILKRQMDWAC
ncbi:MAG: shikimate dehydrogenase [Gammaproteobacteria bacterium]|nr:shikimate dehydrogenase [Gammaproteobacteria bacterium]